MTQINILQNTKSQSEKYHEHMQVTHRKQEKAVEKDTKETEPNNKHMNNDLKCTWFKYTTK